MIINTIFVIIAIERSVAIRVFILTFLPEESKLIPNAIINQITCATPIVIILLIEMSENIRYSMYVITAPIEAEIIVGIIFIFMILRG